MTVYSQPPVAEYLALVIGGAAILSAVGRARGARAVPLGRGFAWSGGAASAALLVLGATAFVLTGNRHASLASPGGWSLFAHVIAGAVFLATTAAASLISLRAFRSEGKREQPELAIRLGFLGTSFFGALAAAPIAISMYGLSGTLLTERLLDVHRWAGLGAFVLGTVTTARVVRRRGRRSGGTGRPSGSGALGDTY